MIDFPGSLGIQKHGREQNWTTRCVILSSRPIPRSDSMKGTAQILIPHLPPSPLMKRPAYVHITTSIVSDFRAFASLPSATYPVFLPPQAQHDAYRPLPSKGLVQTCQRRCSRSRSRHRHQPRPLWASLASARTGASSKTLDAQSRVRMRVMSLPSLAAEDPRFLPSCPDSCDISSACPHHNEVYFPHPTNP